MNKYIKIAALAITAAITLVSCKDKEEKELESMLKGDDSAEAAAKREADKKARQESLDRLREEAAKSDNFQDLRPE